MKALAYFYLMTSATHVVPLIAITLTLQYGTAFPFLPKKWYDWPPLKQGLRNIGLARVEQLVQFFNSDLKSYLTKLCLVVSCIQLTTVNLIFYAIEYDVPLPFAPDLDNLLAPGAMTDLLIFSVITSIIQLIPMFLLVFALLYGIPLPFLRSPPAHRKPPISEIRRWEQQSKDFASIRLTRFKSLAKTFFYAKCREERTGAAFKLALCQGINEGAGTECYLYYKTGRTLRKIVPAPIGVNELEEIFSLGDE